MKTRNGFVSNSSSSSFIVVFPKKPQSEKEVMKRLFNGQEGHISYYDMDVMHHSDISAIVYKDLKDKRKATAKEISEEYESDIWHDAYELERNFRREHTPTQMMFDKIHTLSSDLIDLCKKKSDLVRKQDDEKDIFCVRHDMTHFWADLSENEELDKLRREFDAKQRKELDPISRKIDKEVNKISLRNAKQFIEDHKGFWFTILSYADDGGQGLLEHGGIFKHIEHQRISHH